MAINSSPGWQVVYNSRTYRGGIDAFVSNGRSEQVSITPNRTSPAHNRLPYSLHEHYLRAELFSCSFSAILRSFPSYATPNFEQGIYCYVPQKY